MIYKALLSIFLLLCSAPAATLGPWVQRASNTTAQLWSVADGSPRMIAVGNGGTIVRSADRINWFPSNSGTTTDLRCVTFGAGIYIAAGTNGMTLRSTDGINWTQQIVSPEVGWWAATRHAGKFILGGSGGTIATSTDAQNWTTRTLPDFNGMIFGLHQGATVCEGGRVFSSPDAINWTYHFTDPDARNFSAVTMGSLGYAIVGDNGATSRSPIYTTPNFTDWTLHDSLTILDLNGVAWAGPGLYLAVGDRGTTIYSANLSAWTHATQAGVPTLRSVIYTSGAFYAVGADGYIGERAFSDVEPPAFHFETHPQSRVSIADENVTFTARAVSPNPITYQWLKDGFPIPGATTDTLTFRVLDSGDEGLYNLRATSNGETIHSQYAELVVRFRPLVSITEPAAGALLTEGSLHRVTIFAQSPNRIANVTLYEGESILATFTAPPYELQQTFAVGEHTIRAVAQTEFGITGESVPITFRVQQTLPRFEMQPYDQRALSGRDIELLAEASGPGTLSYQWTFNGEPIPNATAPSYRIQNLIAARAGEYRLIVSNEFGSTPSRIATVRVETQPPAFLSQFWRADPRKPYEPYISIAAGNGMIVVVGLRGYVAASRDGIAWHDVSPPDWFTDFHRVRFLAGEFWALSGNSILSSTDGLLWRQNPAAPAPLRDITEKDGVILAVGDRGWVHRRNLDGAWQSTQAPIASGLSFWGVASGNGLYVALTSNTSTQPWVSEDGVTWTQYAMTPNEPAYDVTFFNGHFIALCGGGIYTSIDGRNWALRVAGAFPAAAVTPSRVVALGNNRIVAYSSDAATWTTVPNSGRPSPRDIAFNGSAYFMVDAVTDFPLSGSLNGLSWTPLGPQGYSVYIPALSFARDRFYVGQLQSGNLSGTGSEPWILGAVVPDDQPWTEFSGVAYGAGRYIATVNSSDYTYASDDGLNFQAQQRSAALSGLVYQDGEFLAKSGTYVARSQDGITWTIASVPGTIFCVGKGNGIALAVGTSGRIYRSANGGPWLQVPSGGTTTLEGIAYGHDKFVVVGNGYVSYSVDGSEWIPANRAFTTELTKVIFAEDMFVASANGGQVAYSWDGINWSIHRLHTAVDLFGIAHGNGRWAVVGRGGPLFQTGPRYGAVVPQLAINSDTANPTLTIAAPPNQLLSIEKTESLTAPVWTPHRRLISTGNPHQLLIDADAAQEFFRVQTE